MCEISITSCFWSGSGQEQLSHSAGALVFPSPTDQEALGSTELKPRQPLLGQESAALGWVGATGRGRVLFCLNSFLCSKRQSGDNSVWSETMLTALSHLASTAGLGGPKHISFTNHTKALSSYFEAEDVPDFAFRNKGNYFVTHGCCLPTPPPNDTTAWLNSTEKTQACQGPAISLHLRLNSQPKANLCKGSLSFLHLKWRGMLQVWEEQGAQHHICPARYTTQCGTDLSKALCSYSDVKGSAGLN